MVRKIFRNAKLVVLFTQTMFQAALQYRLGLLTWVVNGAIAPLFVMSIWLVVGQFGSLPLSGGEIVTYYLFTLFVGRATQTWTISDVGREIVTGDFSAKLLKPINYLIEDFGRSWGLRFIRFTSLVPIFFLLVVALSKYIHLAFQLGNAILFIAAIFLGLVVRFYLENLLVTLVFWTNDVHSIDMCDDLLRNFFSGSLIPIFLAPLLLKNIMVYLPYRYYISFPIEVVMGKLSPPQLFQGFTLGLGFVFILAMAHQWLFSQAVKRYGAFGK